MARHCIVVGSGSEASPAGSVVSFAIVDEDASRDGELHRVGDVVEGCDGVASFSGVPDSGVWEKSGGGLGGRTAGAKLKGLSVARDGVARDVDGVISDGWNDLIRTLVRDHGSLTVQLGSCVDDFIAESDETVATSGVLGGESKSIAFGCSGECGPFVSRGTSPNGKAGREQLSTGG